MSECGEKVIMKERKKERITERQKERKSEGRKTPSHSLRAEV